MADMTQWKLEDLTGHIGRAAHPESQDYIRGMAELNRRQLVAMIEATGAQKDAAVAARRNANYMLASVVVAAVSAASSAAAAYFAYAALHVPH